MRPPGRGLSPAHTRPAGIRGCVISHILGMHNDGGVRFQGMEPTIPLYNCISTIVQPGEGGLDLPLPRVPTFTGTLGISQPFDATEKVGARTGRRGHNAPFGGLLGHRKTAGVGNITGGFLVGSLTTYPGQPDCS